MSGGYVRFTAGLSGDDRKNFDRAIQLLGSLWNDVKATETAASHIITASNLITGLRFAARTGEAEKVLNEALLVAPDDRQLKLHLIEINLLGGEPERELAELDRLPESVRGAPQLLALRAEAYMVAQRFGEAVQTFDALASSPEVKHRSVLQLDNVRALWFGGRRAEATAAAEALVSTQPMEPAFHVALSFVKRQGGDKTGAREAALKALELAPYSDGLCAVFIAEELYAAEV